MDFGFDQTDRDEADRTRPYFVTGQSDDGDATATIYLSRTYKAHGNEVDRLEISEPTAKQIELLGATENRIQGTSKLLAALAKVPYATVGLLKARDLTCCYEALASLGFLEIEE